MMPPDFLVLFAGQSNSLGHAQAITGNKPENDNVFSWSNGGDHGEWRIARLGQAPFNEKPGEPNNSALHFADRLQRHTGGRVFLAGRPVNGSTLLSWAGPDAVNMKTFLHEMSAALASGPFAGKPAPLADSFLWSQGESDDAGATMVTEPKADSLESYTGAFARLIDCLSAQPWFSPATTRFIAAELVEDGWLCARNDFYRSPARWPAHIRMRVTPAAGLSSLKDRAHFDGPALEEIGRRMFEVRKQMGEI